MFEANSNIIDVSEETFDEEVIQQSFEVPILVDFWAPWCAPCRTLGPILERLAQHTDYYFVLAKVNADENPGLSMQFQVRGIPAVMAFYKGEMVGQFVGVKPEPQIRKFLDRVFPNEIDEEINEAASLLAIRHWGVAEEVFRDLLDLYPQKQTIQLYLAKALLGQGLGYEAQQLLQNCSNDVTYLQAKALQPLAILLARVEQETADETEQMDSLELQYRQAGRLWGQGKMEAALDGLLEVLKQDKRYRKGEVRDVLLGIFAFLGEEDSLTQAYRREMALVLF